MTIDKKLSNFFSNYREINFTKGELIIRAEDSPQGVYYVNQGYVRLYSMTPDGTELTLNIFKPGSFFPLSWALSDIPNAYFYESIGETKVFCAPKEKVVTFIASDNLISFDIARRILLGLDSILVRLQYLTLGDAYHRIANALLLLCRRFGKRTGKRVKISIPITQQDIANLAAVTRETVSLELKKLEKDGFIKRNKRIFVIKNIEEFKKESLIRAKGKTLPYSF